MEIVLFCTGTVMKLLVCYESRNLLRLSRLRSQIIWFKSPHYGTVFNNNLLSKFSSNVTCQSICFDIQSNRRKWLQTTIIIVIYNPLSNLTWVKRCTLFWILLFWPSRYRWQTVLTEHGPRYWWHGARKCVDSAYTDSSVIEVPNSAISQSDINHSFLLN